MNTSTHISTTVLGSLPKIGIPALFIFSLFSFSSNGHTFSRLLNDNIKVNNQLPEKVYVHLNKDNFYTEEDIWFKVFLVNNKDNTPGTNSGLAYIDLIDPKKSVIATRKIKITEGFGEGNIFLPIDLIEGAYIIRAYTNYMRNFDVSYFFTKELYIKSQYGNNQIDLSNEASIFQKLDLQFFPEGGCLVNGFNNRVGFKAVNEDGVGVDLEGKIVDEAGDLVCQFNASKFGRGLFHLLPENGKKYIAIVHYKNNSISFELPKAFNQWAIVRIVEHKDHYRANIESSSALGMKNFRFVAYQKKGIVYDSNITENTNKAIAKITKDVLEPGIVQFKLYDNHSKIVAERLSFFEDKANIPKVSLTQSEFLIDNQIDLKLRLYNVSQDDSIAHMSISVTELSVNEADKYNLDIESYLLLTSRLNGTIENPGYYFHSDDPNRKKNLDILMLTQRYREFAEIPRDIKKLKFKYEKGITLSGKVKGFVNRNRAIRSEVSLAYKNNSEQGYDVAETDENGVFIFRNLNFMDSTSVRLEAKSLSLEKETFIEIDSISHPKIASVPKGESTKNNNAFVNTPPIDIKNSETLILKENVLIQLNEVEVTSKRKEKKIDGKKNERRVLYKEASHTVDFKELRNSMAQLNVFEALQGRIPGYSFRGDGVYLRGGNTLSGDNRALLIIDGTPIGNDDSLVYLAAAEIDFVDVITGPRAAIYGSRAGKGVIVVYTLNSSKKNKINSNNGGILRYTHPGMSPPKKFHFGKLRNESNSQNSQKTIYWNPNILITKSNDVELSFPSGDRKAEYEIRVEGITVTGSPIKVTSRIRVK